MFTQSSHVIPITSANNIFGCHGVLHPLMVVVIWREVHISSWPHCCCIPTGFPHVGLETIGRPSHCLAPKLAWPSEPIPEGRLSSLSVCRWKVDDFPSHSRYCCQWSPRTCHFLRWGTTFNHDWLYFSMINSQAAAGALCHPVWRYRALWWLRWLLMLLSSGVYQQYFPLYPLVMVISTSNEYFHCSHVH